MGVSYGLAVEDDGDPSGDGILCDGKVCVKRGSLHFVISEPEPEVIRILE